MKDKLHILFISSWYPSAVHPTLGIFNRYFALAVSLYNRVSVLNIVSELKAENKPEVHEENNELYTVNVHYKKVTSGLPLASQWQRRQKVIQAAETGFEHMIKIKGMPDLIHINVAMPMGIPAIHLAEKYKIPYVVNENWSGYCKEDGNYKGFIQKYFTSKIIAGAKAILPTSTYLRDAMLSHGLQGNYRVIPNVVNTAIFKPLEKTKTSTRFIHISSLNDREKNVSGLLRAFNTALQSRPDLELVIVGEGSDKQKYLEMVDSFGISKQVRFAGNLFADKLVLELNNADALIMFSNFETFCLVIPEAFACGKPVITSAAGAIPSYMQPQLGTMVPVKDENALAKEIASFDSRKFDPRVIREYAVNNFSYEKVGKDLDDIYRAAIKNQN